MRSRRCPRRVIHLFLVEPLGSITRRICLTYDECLGLVAEIRAKLRQLSKAELGACAFCGKMAYINKTNYLLASGELIHGSYMEPVYHTPSLLFQLYHDNRVFGTFVKRFNS